MIDNDCSATDCVNTVRGIEVQAYSGTNNAGVNTGIATFAKTFGIHAETTAQAGSVAQAAAGFFDLNNSSDGSLGNAIRAYSDNATSTDLVSILHETSTFTGTAIVVDMASGSGSFTGNFLDLQKNGGSKFLVDDEGTTTISLLSADDAEGLVIDSTETTGSQVIMRVQSDVTTSNQDKFSVRADGTTRVSLINNGTFALCQTTNGNNIHAEITDCNPSAGADFAEIYPVQQGVGVGEVVMLGSQTVNTYDATNGIVDWQDVKGTIKQLVRADKPYDGILVGVVSDNYGDFNSTGYNIKPEDNPKSIAMNGRVLVKVNMQNGAIQPGDYLTSSSVPGVAMKATKPGTVIGQALAPYDGTQGDNMVMVFIRTSYYDPTMLVNADGTITMQRGEATTTLIAATSQTAFLINQEGSGDLLQLQTNGTNRFLVQNNGAVNINAIAEDEVDNLFVVSSDEEERFSIDARGSVKVAGVIFVKDDTFAGSVATDENGEAEIDFTYDLGTGKPVVQLTPESEEPVFAQVVEWKQDNDDNYIGFKIKTFSLGGQIASSVVHYNVTGKQTGYETNGEVIEVVNAPSPSPSPSPAPAPSPSPSPSPSPAPAPTPTPAPEEGPDDGGTTPDDDGTVAGEGTDGGTTPPADEGSGEEPDATPTPTPEPEPEPAPEPETEPEVTTTPDPEA
jgi:hypothetical protein